MITIDADPGMAIGNSAALVFPNLPVGDHAVQLLGIASNCAVQGLNPRTVSVAAGSQSTTTFVVSCDPILGILEVTTQTNGIALDPDGYTVHVDGGIGQSIGLNATLSMANLRIGGHTVELKGTAGNCLTGFQNPRTVTVVANATQGTEFQITCVSPPSGMIAFSSDRDGDGEIYVMNVDGTGLTQLTQDSGIEPSWSPDASKIAFSTGRDGNREIYVMNADGSGQLNLTQHLDRDFQPAWSPDGTRIAFITNRDSFQQVYVMNEDGSGVTRLTNISAHDGQPAWSPNSSRIAFQEVVGGLGGNPEILVINADGSNPTNLTNSPSTDFWPQWSPDGSQISFVSDLNVSTQFDVYVMQSDGSNARQLTDDSGFDRRASWSPDGNYLVFASDRDHDRPEIYIMNREGRGLVRLTNNTHNDNLPVWRP